MAGPQRCAKALLGRSRGDSIADQRDDHRIPGTASAMRVAMGLSLHRSNSFRTAALSRGRENDLGIEWFVPKTGRAVTKE